MFKWFKKKLFKVYDKAVGDIRLFKLPVDCFRHIEDDLRPALRTFDSVVAAYLVGVEYKQDNSHNLALLIDSTQQAQKVIAKLSHACLSAAPIDIIFFEHLPQTQILEITKSTAPFYRKTFAATKTS